VSDSVEDDYGVTVDVVLVGDVDADERTATLVDAAGEALRNAARHARVDVVSLYAEISGGGVEVFVRDRGVGFELEDVPEDRRGIAESIRGRMDRLGGEVSIRTEPGAGTEVSLRLDLQEEVDA
jgi:signal transduction histidine kinase